jgi:hypothetical protein
MEQRVCKCRPGSRILIQWKHLFHFPYEWRGNRLGGGKCCRIYRSISFLYESLIRSSLSIGTVQSLCFFFSCFIDEFGGGGGFGLVFYVRFINKKWKRKPGFTFACQ